MVTKKTRLLSAIAAVLMLVSMFTSVVLPVSAENTVPQGELPSITALINDGTKSDIGYTVSNADEWKLLEKNAANANITANHTIYITENIDLTGYTGKTMEGLLAAVDGDMNNTGVRSEIKGLTFETGLFGIKIPAIRDLIFRECNATKVGGNSTFLIGGTSSASLSLTSDYINLAFYDCTATKKSTGNTFAFLARAGKATKLTFENIYMEGCTLKSESTNSAGDCNHAFLLSAAGASQSEGLSFKNIVLLNNTMDLVHWDTSYGLVAGEIKTKNSTFENILVMGNTVKATTHPSTSCYAYATGLMVGNLSSGAAATIKNAIAVDNTVNNTSDTEMMTALVGGYGSDNTLTATNVYAQRTDAVTSKVALQSGSTYTYGNNAIEAALALNAAGVTQKWGLTSEGELTFVKDGEKEVKKVTVEIRNPEDESVLGTYTDYTDVSGKLLDTTPYADQAVLWTEPVDGAIVESTVIGYVVPDHTCEWVNYQSNNDGTHSYECGCKWTVTGVGVVSCDKTGTTACNQNKKLNVTDENTEEPSLVHMVVSACSLCDYSDPNAVEEKCTGAITEVGRDPIENSCDLHVISACSKCDYEHVKTVAGEHSTVYEYQQSAAYPQLHEVLCSRCGAFIDVEGHTLNWEVTTPPSVDQEGVKTGTCVCGKTETMVLGAKEGIEVVIEDDVYINQDFDVKVNLKNSSGIMGMQLKINFNKDEVMLVGIENGGDWPELYFGGDLPAGEADDGEVLLNLLNATNMYMDGTMIVLKFKALNNPENLDKASVIKVTEEKTWNYDMEAVEIDDTKATAEAELSIKKGDMNCDGFVNMVDASFLMRYVNEKALDADKHTLDGTTLITDKMADLTEVGDGDETDDIPEVNVNDVIHLLRYLNGQIAL